MCGLEQADSSEFEPRTPHRVTSQLRESLDADDLSGRMRLGARPQPEDCQ